MVIWHLLVVNFGNLPTPPILFRRFERGEISREELQATMALHARELIDEMLEERENPRTSYLERLRNFTAARRLVRRHGAPLVREVLATMGRIEDFPPAQLLWNAGHSDVPLHCFFRTRIEPVFRIRSMNVEPMSVEVAIEYGPHDRRMTIRETILLRRDSRLALHFSERNFA